MLGRVPDLPFSIPASSSAAVLAGLDREGKLDRALEALGPLAGRDVLASTLGRARSPDGQPAVPG
jgi:hypothetical protein